MRSKKRLVTIAVLALTGVALIAVPAVAMRGRMGGGQRGMGRGMGPAFTDEQLEQIEKIHDKYNDERAELTNRLKVIMVEAREADTDGEPDYNAIERNIEEVADIRVQLAKLRLQIHREIRPLLDDDQKVLFDRGLAGVLHGGRGGLGGGHPGMMGRRGGMGHGGTMGRGGAMGRGGMKGGPGCGPGMGGGMPGQPGMGRGMGQGVNPWCPFADDATVE
jgi:Spy/CpxP family protein refolding chaperone